MTPAGAVLITGAAGNLGSRLARHLSGRGYRLRLMHHLRPLPGDLASAPNVTAIQADLGDPRSLPAAVAGADAIVHFAGVLFAPRPERFLPVTNTLWLSNLLDAALLANVSRVVLISFPQVEGETSFDHPATGRVDRTPISVHARTRLEEERRLLERAQGTRTTPVVLRSGMVYGRGILMIDAAHWLARHRLLAVWRKPTVFQLISTVDFVRAVEAAIATPAARGIYHVGDEQPITIQAFLDGACDEWHCPRPFRVPFWLVYLTAALCEAF